MKNNRRVSNAIIDKGGQLRLLIPFLIMLLISAVVIMMIDFQIDSFAAQLPGSQGSNSLSYYTDFSQFELHILETAMSGLIGIAIAALVFWFIYSHRIFGPMEAIRQQLDRLCEGDLNHNVTLRRFDEFKPVAEKLNRLTELLREQKNTK